MRSPGCLTSSSSRRHRAGISDAITISPWPRRRFRDRHNRRAHNRWRKVAAAYSKGSQLLFAQNYAERPNHIVAQRFFTNKSRKLLQISSDLRVPAPEGPFEVGVESPFVGIVFGGIRRIRHAVTIIEIGANAGLGRNITSRWRFRI